MEHEHPLFLCCTELGWGDIGATEILDQSHLRSRAAPFTKIVLL